MPTPPEKAPSINTCTELEKADTYICPMGTYPFHQKQKSGFAHEGLEKGSYRQEESLDSATIPSSGLPKCSSLTKESLSGNTSNPEKYPISFQRAGILLSTPGACRLMSPVQSIVFLLHHPMELSNHERHWDKVEDAQRLAEELLALCIICPPTDEGQLSAPLSAGNVHTGIHLHLPCSNSVWLTRSVAGERN